MDDSRYKFRAWDRKLLIMLPFKELALTPRNARSYGRVGLEDLLNEEVFNA